MRAVDLTDSKSGRSIAARLPLGSFDPRRFAPLRCCFADLCSFRASSASNALSHAGIRASGVASRADTRNEAWILGWCLCAGFIAEHHAERPIGVFEHEVASPYDNRVSFANLDYIYAVSVAQMPPRGNDETLAWSLALAARQHRMCPTAAPGAISMAISIVSPQPNVPTPALRLAMPGACLSYSL